MLLKVFYDKEEEYIAKGGLQLRMGLYSEEYVEKMANNNGLTDDEVEEKNEIINEGFPYWDATDYKQYQKGILKFGRKDFDNIAHLVNKTKEEVKAYHEAFWERGQQVIPNFSYILNKIEQLEKNQQMSQDYRELVNI